MELLRNRLTPEQRGLGIAINRDQADHDGIADAEQNHASVVVITG
jgi:hypothetical protein